MAIQRFGGLMEDFMPQTFSSMLDRFFQDSVNQRQRVADYRPHVDTCETDNGYELELTLPGLRKEDIHIEFQEGRLTVSGERKFKNEKNEKRYHVIESQYGSFSRSFQLPNHINPAAIQAEFQDGILRINVPKDEQKTQKHQIRIKDAAPGQAAAAQQPLDARPPQNSGIPQSEVTHNGQTIEIGQNNKKPKAKNTATA